MASALACLVFIFLSFTQLQAQLSKFEGVWNVQFTSGTKEEETSDDFQLNVTSTGHGLTCQYSDLKFSLSGDLEGEVHFASSSEHENVENAEATDHEFDSDASELLCAFEFVNRTNGLSFSSGSFNGKTKLGEGSYLLVLTSADTFLLTIFNSQGANIAILTGKKIPKEDTSFWSRLPSPALMFAMFLISQYFKPRQPTPRLPGEQNAQRVAQQQQPQQPRVEEVVD